MPRQKQKRRPLQAVIIHDKYKRANPDTLRAYKVVAEDLLKDPRYKDSQELKDALKACDLALARPLGFAEDANLFVHDEIVQGIKADRVKELIDRGVLNKKQVFRLIPERTFKRRLANDETLKISEADVISRLLRINEAANRTFGDEAFARKFLSLPNPALGDRIPNELAETDAGARQVEAILGRIAHGVYS